MDWITCLGWVQSCFMTAASSRGVEAHTAPDDPRLTAHCSVTGLFTLQTLAVSDTCFQLQSCIKTKIKGSIRVSLLITHLLRCPYIKCAIHTESLSVRCSCSWINTGCHTQSDKEPTCPHGWRVGSERLEFGQILIWGTPLPRTAVLAPPGLHCATAAVRTARPLPSGCHGDRSVFWSMTGSTWKNRAAVVAASLRMQPLFVLLSPGFPLRHVLTDSQIPVEGAGGAL